MYIYLDDERTPPKTTFDVIHVYNSIAAIRTIQILKAQDQFDFISLDHDLGGDDTGYSVVKWMAENNIWPKNKPIIHSANPVGRKNMESLIDRYGPYSAQ